MPEPFGPLIAEGSSEITRRASGPLTGLPWSPGLPGFPLGPETPGEPGLPYSTQVGKENDVMKLKSHL